MIIQGNALNIPLKNESIQCCITSPPYYGLRDYGTAKWEGGDTKCDHQELRGGVGDTSAKHTSSAMASTTYQYRDTCLKCGAIQIDNQLGLEPTPEAYVQNIVQVFREVWRVLKKDGTCWVNLGDNYAGRGGTGNQFGQIEAGLSKVRPQNPSNSLKPKDIIGIPWRVAFALQADGWWLRQDIIWHKPNPMPESVTDRCTKSHEYLFLLTKNAKYYYNSDAIKTPLKNTSVVMLMQNIEKQTGSTPISGKTNGNMKAVRPHGITRDRLLDYNSKEKLLRTSVLRGGYENEHDLPEPALTANKKSVWTIATKCFKGAHFAVMPEKLVEPCVLAGSRPWDIVLDPFSGSGTVGVVAEKYQREFIGLELNMDYIKISKKRLFYNQIRLI
jgi:DNA modification methylase